MTRTGDRRTYCNNCSIFPPNNMLRCIYRIIKELMPPLTHPGYLSPPYLPVQRYLHWNNQHGARLLHWLHGLSWHLMRDFLRGRHPTNPEGSARRLLYCCWLRTKESSAEGGSRRAAPPTDDLCQEKKWPHWGHFLPEIFTASARKLPAGLRLGSCGLGCCFRGRCPAFRTVQFASQFAQSQRVTAPPLRADVTVAG